MELKQIAGVISLENAKKFMQIDFNDEDENIELFLAASVEYMKDALDVFDETRARVRFLVFAFTSFLFQNREYIADIKAVKPPYHITSMINQINLGSDSDE